MIHDKIEYKNYVYSVKRPDPKGTSASAHSRSTQGDSNSGPLYQELVALTDS
jgi:hypothetical protein